MPSSLIYFLRQLILKVTLQGRQREMCQVEKRLVNQGLFNQRLKLMNTVFSTEIPDKSLEAYCIFMKAIINKQLILCLQTI